MSRDCSPSSRRTTSRERDRLESLYSYLLLDTASEEIYEHVALMAARTCEAPMAAIALVDDDRVWFKARHGISRTQVPRAGTFCTELVAQERPLTVPDSRRDPRFPTAAVDGVIAYAGVPLVGRDGLPIGSLCVFDLEAREFTAANVEWLSLLAEQVVAHIELRRVDRRLGLAPDSGPAGIASPEGLRTALDRGELRPWFQPIVDLATGRRSGSEALMRWEHPERGTVSPADFLPLLEATGLMRPAGRRVSRLALAALAAARARGREAATTGVSINVSALELEDGFARGLIAEVARAGVPPRLVTVELTETGTGSSLDAVRCELTQLREAGLRVDADDFGSGQATLQRLLDLPLTGIKLDLGLVSRVPHDQRVSRVVRWLVAGAHDLGLGVVAEGVETEVQRDFLLEIGCDRAQGYLFGRPTPRLVA